MNKQFNVCFIISLINYNEHIQYYIDMLYKSLESLNKYYHVDNLYILMSRDNNKYDEVSNIIKNNIKDICHNVSNVNIIDININDIKIRYPKTNINCGRIDKTALIKFYIPKYVNVDNVFYFDCDILFYGNLLNNLWDSINDSILFKMYGIYGTYVGNLSEKHKSAICNSGIIYINCKLYNELNILDKVIEFYNKWVNQYFVDQTCFTVFATDYFKEKCIIHNNLKYNINILLYNTDNIKYGIYHIWGHNKSIFNEIYNIIKNKKLNEEN